MHPAFLPIATGSLITALLLAVAHYLAWPFRGKMHRTVAYCIGVSCIGVGILVASALLNDWLVLITFVGVALPGGLLILGAWWLRGALGTPADVISRRVETARNALRGTPDARDN